EKRVGESVSRSTEILPCACYQTASFSTAEHRSVFRAFRLAGNMLDDSLDVVKPPRRPEARPRSAPARGYRGPGTRNAPQFLEARCRAGVSGRSRGIGRVLPDRDGTAVRDLNGSPRAHGGVTGMWPAAVLFRPQVTAGRAVPAAGVAGSARGEIPDRVDEQLDLRRVRGGRRLARELGGEGVQCRVARAAGGGLRVGQGLPNGGDPLRGEPVGPLELVDVGARQREGRRPHEAWLSLRVQVLETHRVG